MVSVASAWDGLAAELGSASSFFEAVTSGLVNDAWQGPAAAAMAAAASPYTAWLSAAGAVAEQVTLQMLTATLGIILWPVLRTAITRCDCSARV